MAREYFYLHPYNPFFSPLLLKSYSLYIQPKYIKEIVSKMESSGFVTDTLSMGESKFMVREIIIIR